MHGEYVSWPPVRDCPDVPDPWEQIQQDRFRTEQVRIAAVMRSAENDRRRVAERRAEEMAYRRRFPKREGKAVVCLEADRKYASLSAAARAHGIKKHTLAEAVKRRQYTKGTLNGKRQWLTFYFPAVGPPEAPTEPRDAREHHLAKPVVCLDTGVRYGSVKAAVLKEGQCRREFKRLHKQLIRAIEAGKPFDGKRWRWIRSARAA